MSFNGLASAMVVIVVIGMVLGVLMKLEFDRMQEPSTRSVESPTATPTNSSAVTPESMSNATASSQTDSTEVGQSEEDLQQWEEELKRWDEDLQLREDAFRQAQIDFQVWRRETEAELKTRSTELDLRAADVDEGWETLNQAELDFEAWKQSVETEIEAERARLRQLAADLEEGRKALAEDQGDFDAWKQEVEAKIEAEREKVGQLQVALEKEQADLEQDRVEFQAHMAQATTELEAQREDVRRENEAANQVLNWAVMAMCGAGAVTIGNTAVAIVRRRPRSHQSEASTAKKSASLRRAYLRPKEASARGRRDGQVRTVRDDSEEGADSLSSLWSQLMDEQQSIPARNDQLGTAGIRLQLERTGAERAEAVPGVTTAYRRSDSRN